MAVKLRDEQRLERFLAAARTIISKKRSIDFTVQEVVEQSHQSLRSFYQHFDGKHELLLTLFEDALRQAAERIRAAAAGQDQPLARLRVAVELLFEQSRRAPAAARPLFTDFASRLLISHPAEMKAAHAPLLTLLTELMEQAEAGGALRGGSSPRRLAALTMQTVMFTAQASGAAGDQAGYPITAAEAWEFCATGFAGSVDHG